MAILTTPSRNGKHSLLSEALGYHRRGWCVIPTRGKKPACRWRQFQSRRPTRDELRQLFSLHGTDGLAVVLGAVSGGLACRDFDDASAYNRWKRDHPKLAKRLPTVRTSRGYHVYFVGPDEVHDCGDGEYRGDGGHFVLLPPSRHPDGTVYRWVVLPPDGDLLRIDPFKTGLVKVTQRRRDSETQEMSGSLSLCVSELRLKTEDSRKVERAIAGTQPEMQGERHRRIFEFCRRLKGIPALAEADPRALRPVAAEWHRRALPVIGTKDFAETWGDFVNGWRKVKHPDGEGTIDAAFKRALERKPPKLAVKLYGERAPIVKLAALCRELQRGRSEGEFFYLDCRTAGRILGVSHKTAWAWLNALVADGLLVAGEKGSRAAHKASEYCYVAQIARSTRQGEVARPAATAHAKPFRGP